MSDALAVGWTWASPEENDRPVKSQDLLAARPSSASAPWSLAGLSLLGLVLAGCFQTAEEGDDEIGATDTTEGDTSESEATDSSTSEDGCGDSTAPTLLTSLDPIPVPPGQTSIITTLEFDEPVELGAGALSVSGGATIESPTLPTNGISFMVEISGVDAGMEYVLSVEADAINDACDNQLAADAEIPLVGACLTDMQGPALTSATIVQLEAGTTSTTYLLEFDEPVTLAEGSLALGNGAMITSIDPPLPATSTSFELEISGLVDFHELTLDGALASDGCGNLAEAASVWVCTIDELVFGFTGAPASFTVPGCADGLITIEAWGAQGRAANNGGAGGLGGFATGQLAVETGETLLVTVGGQLGFNGGGTPGSGSNGSGNGGGASDVRQGAMTLEARVIVAGGGGGGAGRGVESCAGGAGGDGGIGGGLTGGTGGVGLGCGGMSTGGIGGSQASGGTGGIGHTNCTQQAGPGTNGQLGQGGNGGNGTNCNGGGFTGSGGAGAGGGYFGGGGGAGGPGGGGGAWGGGGGGGGSSFVGGVEAGETSEGVQPGDGQVIISW